MRRVLATLLLGGVLVLTCAAAAWSVDGDGATDPPDSCFEPNEQGELPTCTDTGSGWEPVYPEQDEGIPDGFVVLIVLGVIAGGAVTVYMVFLARAMARRSGMDPDQATAMTLLTDDGLEATYLASNLRPQPSAPAPDASRTVSQRLAELESLQEQGLVTRTEYDARRAAILDSL
jgi:hypothetical protein